MRVGGFVCPRSVGLLVEVEGLRLLVGGIVCTRNVGLLLVIIVGADERDTIPEPLICNLPLQDPLPKQPCLTV